MKTIRKMLSVTLILMVALSVFVIPAQALEPEWINFMGGFPLTRQTGYQTGYASVVQRFLIVSPTTEDLIADHGGVDGRFGGYTAEAVKVFQRSVGLNDDGEVGTNTWRAMGNSMVEYGGNAYRDFSFARGYSPVIWGDVNGYSSTLYYITSDNDYTGTYLVRTN